MVDHRQEIKTNLYTFFDGFHWWDLMVHISHIVPTVWITNCDTSTATYPPFWYKYNFSICCTIVYWCKIFVSFSWNVNKIPFAYSAAAINGQIGLQKRCANCTIAIRKARCSGGDMSTMNVSIDICQSAGPPEIRSVILRNLLRSEKHPKYFYETWYFMLYLKCITEYGLWKLGN